MLNVYIERQLIKSDMEIIDNNDVVFNYDLYNNMAITPTIRAIMKKIDGADYESGMDVRSRFGNITSMENLSTGCKTMINIVNHPEAVINCIECGDNVLHKIIQMTEGNILLTIIPSNEAIQTNIKLITNQGCCSVHSLPELIQLVV